ncbi:cache domain-containing sensor histidine kinase [Paenibacillus hexagrammi]|uniref:Histidine kinase n=1 Tax=Paenibacillus hexagrammi TaxID=2908839 RepID=A0ABY3SML7_9BACL|nr:histidine kinase [Paenibacillus sp. YPD9-1]UJF34360.1 histidine kinase [Paenibacillus sp. YPD9-1]
MWNRIRSAFTFRSIRYKLMIASLACILLPAACSLYFYNYWTQDAVKKQATSNAQESLMLVNQLVTGMIKNMLNIANYVQSNTQFSTYFKIVPNEHGSNEADIYDRFREENRITEQLENIGTWTDRFYVTILLADGRYFTNYSQADYNPLNFYKESWFPEVERLKGFQSYWTGPTPAVFQQDQLDHPSPYQISVVRTIRNGDQSILGYVIVTVMENQIHQIFDKLSTEEEVMIVDRSNHIVSHPDPKMVGTTYDYSRLNERNQASSIVPIEGENYLITEQMLSFTDWHLVYQQPYKKAIVNISTIFNKVLSFQLIFFLIFLLLLLYLLSTFTKPLVLLGRAATKVQKGNLLIRTGIHGQDEVGRLGFSFDQMLDKINDMIHEVSDTQSRKRKAELAMLQAQINPHFLFNVLNSIRMKVMRRGDQESAEMIGSLSKLLRMTVSQDKDVITLHEEIDLLGSYVSLMNMRQKEEAQLVCDVDSNAFLVKVPRFFCSRLSRMP